MLHQHTLKQQEHRSCYLYGLKQGLNADLCR